MNNINLENINDFQKVLLSEMSYFNITEEGRELILNGGLKVKDLYSYLETPDAVYVGDDTLPKELTEKVMNNFIGDNSFMTHKQLLDSLVNNGLGNIVITHISDRKSMLSNGFQALTFIDSYENTGFSYRGSDFSILQGAVRDWVEADMLEYFTGSSSQIRETLAYFDEHKNNEGKNFLYGYSLGGNLVSHNYLNNYNEVREAFVFNGNPLNQKLLDTQEKIDAFNDSEKYHCNIVGGDIIGQLKSYELYKNNVRYIKNNESLTYSPISAHMVLSSTFDENGNFVYITEEEMIDKMGPGYGRLVTITQNIRELLNVLGNKISKAEYKGSFDVYRSTTFSHFENLHKTFGKNSNFYENDSSNFIEIFQAADPIKQQEFIDMILEYMEHNSDEVEEPSMVR